jgi:hypothetical protein
MTEICVRTYSYSAIAVIPTSSGGGVNSWRGGAGGAAGAGGGGLGGCVRRKVDCDT